MDIGQFAFNVGAASASSDRDRLRDEMKRRVMLDQLEKLAQSNPDAVEQMVRPRATPALGSGGLVRRPVGIGGHGFSDPNLAPAPGSPAYYGKNWGVSPEERYNADAGMRFGPSAYQPVANSGTPTDQAMQEAIREKLIGSLDKSADAQRALLAKSDTAAATPVVASSGASSGKAANSKQITATQSKIEQLERSAKLAENAGDSGKAAIYQADADKHKAALKFLLSGNADVATKSDDAVAGQAFVNPDDLGPSLAGNTPEMMKAVQSRFGAVNGPQAPAPVTPGPDTQPNVAGPYTPFAPGTTKDSAMSPMDAKLAMQYPSKPGMGAGSTATPGTNRGQLGLKEWSPVGQIGMKGGLGSDNSVASGVVGDAAGQTAAQRVAAQIDADIAAIKAKKKKPEDKK